MRGSIFLRAILAIWPGFINSVVASHPLGPTISLSDGAILGNQRDSNGILSFKGIPYAIPPVGDLRWKPTQPAAPWSGTLNATQFGYTCWSNLVGAPPAATPNNEDCLTINVWTGATDSKERRPVMVWIHGGGFQFGSSTEPVYDGTTMAGQGVVVVNFNYRLGVFGFLGLQELDEENGSPSGNFGLQDMIVALGWVQANIAAFGGDPNCVTLFGQSAGAHAVGLLMSSPMAKDQNLFHKGIMESGAWWDRSHGPLTTFDEARQYGLNFETKLNVTSVAELRVISALDINNSQPFSLNQDPGVTGFAPSVDSYVIPTVPGRAFHNGQQMRIPLMAGFNIDEQYLFEGNALPHNTSQELENAAQILFGNRMPEFLSLYPDNTSALLNTSSGELVGDLYIREQTWEAALVHKQTTNMAVWAYYYTYVSPYEPIPTHTAEIPFVFGNLVNNPVIDSVRPPTDQDRAFSQNVMAYWTNFAKTGNPNGASLATWPPYGSGGDDFLELGSVIQPYAPDFLAQYQFIKSFRKDGELPLSWRNLLSVGV